MLASISTYKNRFQDYHRHLIDLRDMQYEGGATRAEREATFRSAVQFTSPVVHEVLEEFNQVFLEGSGTVDWRGIQDDGDEGLISLWILSWPLQQQARRRSEGYWSKESEPVEPNILPETGNDGIDPIIVRAFLPKDGVTGWLHGHLAGRYDSANGMWPLNVTSDEDANRQGIVLWMIAEGELHRCVYEMAHLPMTLLPGAT